MNKVLLDAEILILEKRVTRTNNPRRFYIIHMKSSLGFSDSENKAKLVRILVS